MSTIILIPLFLPLKLLSTFEKLSCPICLYGSKSHKLVKEKCVCVCVCSHADCVVRQ